MSRVYLEIKTFEIEIGAISGIVLQLSLLIPYYIGGGGELADKINSSFL